MLDVLYGWHLKEALSCTFDVITFMETMGAISSKSVDISDATYGSVKKDKLGSHNFIITKMFSVCHPLGMAVECEILPNGDSVEGVVLDAYYPSENVVENPIMIETGVDINYINVGGAANVYIKLSGFWIPKNMVDQLTELSDANTIAVAIHALLLDIANKMGAKISPGSYVSPVIYPPKEVGERVPYCERRRY